MDKQYKLELNDYDDDLFLKSQQSYGKYLSFSMRTIYLRKFTSFQFYLFKI